MHYLFVASRYIIYLKVWHHIASEGDTEEKDDLEKHVLKQVPMLHIMYSLY